MKMSQDPINQNDHTNERNIRPYGGCLGYRVIKQKDPQLTGTARYILSDYFNLSLDCLDMIILLLVMMVMMVIMLTPSAQNTLKSNTIQNERT